MIWDTGKTSKKKKKTRESRHTGGQKQILLAWADKNEEKGRSNPEERVPHRAFDQRAPR